MPLKPKTPISEFAGNQDILNFEQEEHSQRRMEMSPGVVRVGQRLKQRGNWRTAVPQPVLSLSKHWPGSHRILLSRDQEP